MWGLVRPCRPRDIGDIMRLVREIAVLYQVPPEDVHTDEKALLEAGFGDPPLFECFVAEMPPGQRTSRGAAVVGYVLSTYTFSTRAGPTLYMDNLYVQPPYRGLKLGRRLVEAASQAAWARGCRELRMHVGGAGGGPTGVLRALGGAALGGPRGWRLLRCDRALTGRLAAGPPPPPPPA